MTAESRRVSCRSHAATSAQPASRRPRASRAPPCAHRRRMPPARPVRHLILAHVRGCDRAEPLQPVLVKSHPHSSHRIIAANVTTRRRRLSHRAAHDMAGEVLSLTFAPGAWPEGQLSPRQPLRRAVISNRTPQRIPATGTLNGNLADARRCPLGSVLNTLPFRPSRKRPDQSRIKQGSGNGSLRRRRGGGKETPNVERSAIVVVQRWSNQP